MEYNCDECSRNFLLPPPKFISPPPPIPHSLCKNLVKCNDEKVLFQINNWEHNMCASMPIFEESILTGRMEGALTFVGMFACILLLVIGFYIIYVKRLINQRNYGCKNKTLVKNTLQHSDINSSDNHTMFLNKFQYDNLYEQCNQYKNRQTQKLINSVPANNMSNALFAENQIYHPQLKSPNSIVPGLCYYRKPINYSESNYDYLGLDYVEDYSRSNYSFTDYVQSISLIATSVIVNDRAFKSHTPSLFEYQQDFYSIVSKDFDELMVYPRTVTRYGSGEEDNTKPSYSQQNKSQTCEGSSIDSDLEVRRCSQTSINKINWNQYKYNNYNNESYPEYLLI